MRLHTTDDSPVISSGNMKTGKFKIATSAKAFKILSSNLYKNKRLAVIREISCNAVDAHIAAEKRGMNPPAEFDVHLPTVFDKTFRVRDYGIGLSKDDIFDLYTTYFASTKADSDDYIGALGLGSKSPFSYTETFTVTSWHGGTKTIYSAFLSDGEPEVVVMHSEPSDEPNGVEISVPTGQDTSEWAREAAICYGPFETYRPKMIGNDPAIDYLDFDQRGVCSRAPDWRVNRERGIFAVMGGVVYPLPREKYEGSLFWRKHNNTATYVKFAVGELDIAPSREELSLDDITLDNIKAKIDMLGGEYQAEIDTLLAQTDDIRELYRIINASEYSFIWTNGSIDQHVVQGHTVSWWRKHLAGRYGFSIKAESMACYSYTNGELVRKSAKRTSQAPRFGGTELSSCRDFEAKRPPIVVFNDVKTGGLDLLYGMYALGELEESVIYLDMNNKTRCKDTGELLRVAQKRDIMRILRSWRAPYKKGRVIRLSKVRQDIQAKMAAKNISRDKTPTGKREPRIAYWKFSPNGDFSTVNLTATEIRAMVDPVYVIKHIDDFCEFDTKTETKTFKAKNRAPETFIVPGDRMLDCTTDRNVFKALSKRIQKDVYVCRKAEARYFLNHPSAKSAFTLVIDWLEGLTATVTVDDITPTNVPSWLRRMGDTQELIGIYNKIACPSGNPDLIREIRNALVMIGARTSHTRDVKQALSSKLDILNAQVYSDVQKRYDDFALKNPLIVAYFKDHSYAPNEICDQINEFVKF